LWLRGWYNSGATTGRKPPITTILCLGDWYNSGETTGRKGQINEVELGRECSPNGGEEDVGRWIILRWILERYDRVVWTGLVWLRIRTSGELL
jgi:hypothetical protein